MSEELVSITEYAKMQGLTRDTVLQRAKRGSYKTARKIGNNWVLDKNEPHIDHRIQSGKYIKAKKED